MWCYGPRVLLILWLLVGFTRSGHRGGFALRLGAAGHHGEGIHGGSRRLGLSQLPQSGRSARSDDPLFHAGVIEYGLNALPSGAMMGKFVQKCKELFREAKARVHPFRAY